MRIPVGHVSVEAIEAGDRVCLRYLDGGVFEPETLTVWARLCRAAVGRTVLDVGAYTGLFAISAALMGCKVHAFEALPRNAQRSALNIRSNAVDDKVALHKAAVSDAIGEAKFSFNGTMALTSGGSLLAEKRSYTTITVPVVTLDSLDLQDVAAIKIDVERAEPLVLRGAVETLARCRPTLIVEVLGDDEKSAVMAAVKGYEVSEVLDGRNWLMVPV